MFSYKSVSKLAVLTVLPWWASFANANVIGQSQWQFEVLLDEKKIGYHDFVLKQQGEKQTVETTARFDVKLLFVNVFRYRHQNTETWQDNCLTAISAETESNGKDFTVKGQTSGGEFQVNTQSASTDLPACVMTFAYWNPEFLSAKQLLNSQTGEYEDVEISKQGEETLSVNGQNIQAIRYGVDTKAGPLTLWYSAQDLRWLALESIVKGGRILRYEPVMIPPASDSVYGVSQLSAGAE